MATITDRLSKLNELRNKLAMRPLKSWKKASAELDEKIEELSATVEAVETPESEPVTSAPDVNEAPPIAEENAEPAKATKRSGGKKKNAKKSDAKPAASRNGKVTVASVVKPLILEGKSNSDVFAEIMKKHPELLCTEVDGEMKPTKKWYIAWYRGDMRRKGLL